MLLRAINNHFILIYLYYGYHKHLLRNTIKNHLDWPDHCAYINLILLSTYYCLFRGFYIFTSFKHYVIKVNISFYLESVPILSSYLA